jgi:hypothetical protein
LKNWRFYIKDTVRSFSPVAKPIIKSLPYRPVGPAVRIALEKVGNFGILKNALILKSRQLQFNDPRAFDEIYQPKFTKEARFYHAFLVSGSSLACVDSRNAKMQKDILRPLFSKKAILKLENAMQRGASYTPSKWSVIC